MEYYSDIKKNKMMPFAATWMELEILVLGEVGQKEGDRYHMVSLFYGVRVTAWKVLPAPTAPGGQWHGSGRKHLSSERKTPGPALLWPLSSSFLGSLSLSSLTVCIIPTNQKET